jgi:hypothetical protein
VPVVSAKAALPRFWRFGYFPTPWAAVYLDFVRVGRHDSLSRALQKALGAIARKFEYFRIVREQLPKM